MFGLMRAKKCGMSETEKHFRRLHYCGTCKTIGSLYGQKSRLLLNHDAVFLAEILTGISSGESVSGWQSAYQSYNCLNLPETGEMPLPLEFAAAANLILAEFKLADKIADENSRAGKIARKTFSNGFQKAQAKLEREWQFPLAEVREILSAQETIENDSLRQSNKSPGEILDELARPTAATTAIFFGEGSRITGKSELKNAASEIGFRFGKLIYLVDAFEDYEKDFRRGQFNAIRAAFRVDGEKLPSEIRRKIVSILQKLEGEIVNGIYELPMAENQKTLFASRLAQNLQRKLKPSLPVLKTKTACQPQPRKPKQSFSERWRAAAEAARKMARGFSWQMPLVFLFVFVFAMVAPAQTREAKSARECFDLSFNLMFLGAIFGSVLVSAKTVLMENPEELLTKEGRKKKLKKAASGESGGSEGWCDTCECCCCDCGGESGCCGDCNCGCGCCDNCGCGDGCCCDCNCGD
jgi:hypothetical protein